MTHIIDEIARFKTLAGILTENTSSKSEFTGGKQKDWIIYNKDFSNIFCLAIVSDNNNDWYLLEWVNMFDLSREDMFKVLKMGYSTMLEAALHRDEYEYVIQPHNFKKADIKDHEYFNKLVSKNYFGKASFEKNVVMIDKAEFEKNVNKLINA